MSPVAARRRPSAARARRGEAKEARGDGGGGAGPRWLVPVLAVAVFAFVVSAGWQSWLDRREPEARSSARHAPAATPKGIAGAARVEVLNGSGEPGAAAKLASYLREGGFNVVQVGSADRFDYGRTIVIGRTDDPRSARAVSAYLGRVTRIVQRARSEADVTVIVGRDRGRLPWGEGRPSRGRG